MSMPLVVPQMPKMCNCDIDGIKLCRFIVADIGFIMVGECGQSRTARVF